MKRIGHLYEKVTDIENIKKAIINASRKKRDRPSVKRILADLDYFAEDIQRMLVNMTYVPSPYFEQSIIDNSSGKERIIFKPKFYPDQCIHWALMQIIEPTFAKGMYPYTCGSIPKRGVHYGKKAIQRWIKKDPKHTKYILQIDISKFYPSIDHDVLKAKIRKKFKDSSIIWLIDSIVDSTESGLPIGNYTSQWFANFYLQDFDYYVKQDLEVKYFMRYMDDCVMFGNNKKKLHKALRKIEDYFRVLGLKVKRNWQVYRLDKRPMDFLGFRIHRTHVTLRRRNALRIRRRAKKVFKKPILTFKDAAAMMSYLGWIKHSNSHNYYVKHLEPYIDLIKMKEVIRDESRKQFNASKRVCS